PTPSHSLPLPPPPTPPLSPYTTLFRSHADLAGSDRSPARALVQPAPARPGIRGRRVRGDRPAAVERSGPPVIGHRHGALRRPEQDRKSTRLNSSHGSISYAVFCLKKKN